LSRFGAASGAVSVIVTFVGFGVHGGLPSDTTTAAIQSYVQGVNPRQTGAGNYLELLGYLFFLVFATYLYSVARAVGSERLHWLNVLAVTAATTYGAALHRASPGLRSNEHNDALAHRAAKPE